MKYRKLRIAWSVAWGVVAVLILAFWVKSYYSESITGHADDNWRFALGSWQGRVLFRYEQIPIIGDKGFHAESSFAPDSSKWNWLRNRNPEELEIVVPHWFLQIFATALAAVPWIGQLPFRFSLRTLLIATTLVAVGLGAIIWMTK